MTAEQQARDLLQRLGHPDAQSLTAGDLVELANLISEAERARAADAAAAADDAHAQAVVFRSRGLMQFAPIDLSRDTVRVRLSRG